MNPPPSEADRFSFHPRSKIILWGAGSLLFLLGLAAGLGHELFMNQRHAMPARLAEARKGETQFTNPLLDCELGQEYLSENALNNFGPFMKKVTAELVRQGYADFISVYFRDLNNGPWVGVNEKENFYPASLMKLPLLIDLLREAESDPSLLQTHIAYPQAIARTDYYFKPTAEIKEGKTYTVSELLQAMITESDNNAGNLLHLFLGEEKAERVFRDLDVLGAKIPTLSDFMTVRDYASFYRVLYNASYLNQQMSDYALELLSRTKFTAGLAAGVPSGVPVAHKFGELRGKNGADDQLHDCGIVYYPKNPYLICVMTRGKNFDDLANVIRDISHAVYQNVQNQKKD